MTNEFPLGKDNYCPQCYFEDDIVVLRTECKHNKKNTMTTDEQIIKEFKEKFAYPSIRCLSREQEAELKSFLVSALARVRDEEMGLVVSLQRQVNDLRENAREIARRDLIAELRQDILSQGVSITDEQGREWIYKESVLALLDKYTDPK